MTPPASVDVRLEAVTFRYGPVPVVHDVSLTVPAGQLLTLLGPSGCGKTTLLKLIGGYLTPASGRVWLGNRDVTLLPPEARNAGMVFQNYALFPHLSARQNVAFGLEVRGVPQAERDRRVNALLDRVGLAVSERDRKPAALSGGQQQRVALARALIIEPDVLLLDEPLANLDRHLREQLRTELRTLQRETGVTTVLVTHDQEEALALSDHVAVMQAGRILQVGTPREVYSQPQTPFVARFLGAANLLDGKLLGRTTKWVMIRPEDCTLDAPDGWPGRITAVTFLGAETLADVTCDNGVSLRVRMRSVTVAVGDRVRVGIAEDQLWPLPDSPSEPGA